MLRTKKEHIIIILTLSILISLPFIISDYYLYLVRLIAIYAILTIGLNIFMGYCGQINFGGAAFYCIGAYCTTMLQIKLNWHFFFAFPIAMMLNYSVAWLISYPFLRLKGQALAIGTLAFAIAMFLLAERFPELTGGADGIFVPPLVLFGREVGKIFLHYFILSFAAVAYLISYFLVNSDIGRAMKAIRADEVAAAALGVNVNHYKKLAWIANAMFGGVAGALYAEQAGFICPTTFSLGTNITVLIMNFVGGLGSTLGAVVGAGIMTLLSYFLVAIQEFILLVHGLTLFIVIRFLPDGVVGALRNVLTKKNP